MKWIQVIEFFEIGFPSKSFFFMPLHFIPARFKKTWKEEKWWASHFLFLLKRKQQLVSLDTKLYIVLTLNIANTIQAAQWQSSSFTQNIIMEPSFAFEALVHFILLTPR